MVPLSVLVGMCFRPLLTLPRNLGRISSYAKRPFNAFPPKKSMISWVITTSSPQKLESQAQVSELLLSNDIPLLGGNRWNLGRCVTRLTKKKLPNRDDLDFPRFDVEVGADSSLRVSETNQLLVETSAGLPCEAEVPLSIAIEANPGCFLVRLWGHQRCHGSCFVWWWYKERHHLTWFLSFLDFGCLVGISLKKSQPMSFLFGAV